MTPMGKYYEATAQTIMKNFKKRGFEGCYCATAAEAVEKAMYIVEPGMSVSFGGSMTLEESGVMAALKSRKDITLLDRSLAATPDEIRAIYLKALACDCYFMSTNAITTDGVMVNTDGTGNRVAALAYGPKNVVMVIGMNKVVHTLDEAFDRVKCVASPPNCIRLNRQTPCAVTGVCGDCYGDQCICSHTVVTRRCAEPGRIKIILVGESLGY
ncbi:MAG: lactate utilization protein [Clostridiales bacterium]|nr:lactate utilization protein [Clostridiales bacterium]